MISFEVGRPLRTAARILALSALVAPFQSFSQPTVESRAEREREIVAGIEEEESRNGPYSEQLIAPLTALSLFYEEIGEYRSEETAIAQALQVIRANYGLYSLEQAPFIRRMIDREAARGDAEASWKLQWDLLGLATRNPDDIRSAGIMSETGDRRMDILRRYDAGEFPQEIVLGCFYDDTAAQQLAGLHGSQPMSSVRVGPDGKKCGAGSRSAARRSIVASAQGFYLQAVNLYLRNEGNASNEIPELLMKVVNNSYHFPNPALGAEALRNLLSYETAHSGEWLRQIEARIQLADWDLLYASVLGTNREKSARAKYEQAYDQLIEHGIAREAIEDIFFPEMPIVLPAFAANPLISNETSQSTGYIDVSFVITEDGKSKQIEILDTTTDVPRTVARDFVRTIKYSRFRPRMTDGRFAESAPIALRYYLNE